MLAANANPHITGSRPGPTWTALPGLQTSAWCCPGVHACDEPDTQVLTTSVVSPRAKRHPVFIFTTLLFSALSEFDNRPAHSDMPRIFSTTPLRLYASLFAGFPHPNTTWSQLLVIDLRVPEMDLPSLLSLVRRRAGALARRPIAHLRMRLAGGGALFSAGLKLHAAIEGQDRRAGCSSSQPGAGTSVATATGPDSRAGSSTVLRSASCPGAPALRPRPHALQHESSSPQNRASSFFCAPA